MQALQIWNWEMQKYNIVSKFYKEFNDASTLFHYPLQVFNRSSQCENPTHYNNTDLPYLCRNWNLLMRQISTFGGHISVSINLTWLTPTYYWRKKFGNGFSWYQTKITLIWVNMRKFLHCYTVFFYVSKVSGRANFLLKSKNLPNQTLFNLIFPLGRVKSC